MRVKADSVVPLDREAEALPPDERADMVGAILLGQIAGEVQPEIE